jgi:hypothetical protein
LRLAEFEYFSPDTKETAAKNPNYKYPVNYSFNSRGFRDHEWPADSELKQNIWCVGDSGTLGVGIPLSHTWPVLLEQQLQQPTIKIAMVGASNDWIYRQARQILNLVQPNLMVILWSFLHRREIPYEVVLENRWQIFYNNVKDSSWPDCKYKDFDLLPSYIKDEIINTHEYFIKNIDDTNRRIRDHDPSISDSENVKHTMDFIFDLEKNKKNTKLIHSAVPAFSQCLDNKNLFDQEISCIPINYIPNFVCLDFARDSEHWDIKTNQWFIEQIQKFLS